MQELPKLGRLLWLALVLCDAAVLAYMLLGTGLAATPLERLPLLYWALAILLPVLYLIAMMMWGEVPLPRFIGSTADRRHLLFAGGLFLVMALFNHLIQPRWGGNTVLFAVGGCGFLILAYTTYRQRILQEKA
ncbi:MAG TPA: hypothetical protein VF952_00350 [Chloroflexia bacterium]|jgi:hypothetical protein